MDNATVGKRWQIKVKSPLPAGMQLMDIYSEAEKGIMCRVYIPIADKENAVQPVRI